MTAYELAEKAEGLAYEIPADWSSGEPKNLATDIADMLRQQADRIAELEYAFKSLAKRYKALDRTKPLSEKELYEVFDKCYPNNGDGDVVTLVDFARAIEERHGIK